MQEALFVYGSLREEWVQRRVIGRLVPGDLDALEGYGASTITLGRRKYPIISPFPLQVQGSAIRGEVIMLTPEELERTDRYETSAYIRQRVTLRSGKTAWVYTENPNR